VRPDQHARHPSYHVPCRGIDDVLDRLRVHGAELVGELEQYEDIYRLCHVRGPTRIIIELAEQIRDRSVNGPAPEPRRPPAKPFTNAYTTVTVDVPALPAR
jgi:hypothetical protein